MKTNSLRRLALLTVFAAAAFTLAACDPKPDVPNKPAPSPSIFPSPSASPAVSPADGKTNSIEKLVGRWNGPEGTYISITEKNGAAKDDPKKFTVEIKDLDKAETFEGTAKGDAIEFMRKGKIETIKAATGTETGMKGFEKETNCVVVTKGGEGFCRKQ